MTTIRQIAERVGLAPALVRDVLREAPEAKVARAVADRIFQAARELRYDFRKLKIGKRMDQRRQTIEEMLRKIEEHPEWDREEILAHLRKAAGMVERVTKRVFREEFSQDDWW